MPSAKKGFTIVELVIVIAVIAILAAVFIPVFSGAIDNAQLTTDTEEAKAAMVQVTAALDANLAETYYIYDANHAYLFTYHRDRGLILDGDDAPVKMKTSPRFSEVQAVFSSEITPLERGESTVNGSERVSTNPDADTPAKVYVAWGTGMAEGACSVTAVAEIPHGVVVIEGTFDRPAG